MNIDCSTKKNDFKNDKQPYEHCDWYDSTKVNFSNGHCRLHVCILIFYYNIVIGEGELGELKNNIFINMCHVEKKENFKL